VPTNHPSVLHPSLDKQRPLQKNGDIQWGGGTMHAIHVQCTVVSTKYATVKLSPLLLMPLPAHAQVNRFNRHTITCHTGLEVGTWKWRATTVINVSDLWTESERTLHP